MHVDLFLWFVLHLSLMSHSKKIVSRAPGTRTGRGHLFRTVQIRIGKETYDRFYRYCRSRGLWASQALTAMLKNAMDRKGVE